MSNPEAQVPASPQHSERGLEALRRRTGVKIASATLFLAGALGGLGVGVAALDSGPSHSSIVAEAGSPSLTNDCNNAEISQSVFPGDPEELVPLPIGVNSANSAATYTQRLFEKGNLGKRIDPVVAAAIYALITEPATSSGYKAEQTYSKTFEETVQQMTDPSYSPAERLQSARYFCEKNLYVLAQTVGYSSDAIPKGMLYYAVGRGTTEGQIVITKEVAKLDVPGVVYEVTLGSKLNGFYKVVVQTGDQASGTLYIMGPIPTPQVGESQGTGNNQGVSKGNKIESNPNGPRSGPGQGPNGAGTTQEAKFGPGKTPGTGTGSPGGKQPTPTTTTPPTPTTTPPTPTTTLPPPEKGPSPCNPNVGQVCPPQG